MLNLKERFWFSSMFTLPTLMASPFSRAISSMSGAINLQGPHHSAQKSTRTGFSLLFTSRSKFDSVSGPFGSGRCGGIVYGSSGEDPGALVRPGFAGLHVMASPSELAKQTRLLKLSLEQLERAFQAVIITQLYFGHAVLLTKKRKAKRAGALPALLEHHLAERSPLGCGE